ncbi:hypothetical protein PR048_023347 [Dryococelus australis]|uniref:Uncharacterized protein n=1 Tax=Dryococelus australis TaxID=614101 RepID=A0ABQ9GTU6_9NEOP|nr:hypothetical protein PR048_023347 [Dryococelus australis]
MLWEVPTDILLDDWKFLQLEHNDEGSQNKCFMEMQYFNSSPKYPTVTKILKAVLSLSHENADAERSCCSSCRALTPARCTMSE